MGCNSAPAQDVISLNLSIEDTIKSSQANLTILVETVLVDTTPETTRGVILDGLNSIATTDWDISNLQRTSDSSGYERWVVLAKTRVDEKALNNLTTKCKTVSKKGLQFKVRGVDYVPTNAEYQTFFRGLRQRLYAEVNLELAMIKEVTSREYRLANVNFQTSSVNNQVTNNQAQGGARGISGAMSPFNVQRMYSGNECVSAAMDCNGEDDSGDESFVVAQKVVMTLNGTLSTFVD